MYFGYLSLTKLVMDFVLHDSGNMVSYTIQRYIESPNWAFT